MRKWGIAAVLILALATNWGMAQTIVSKRDSYFNGKTVTYIVGSEAGGGYDRYARLIAPFLQENLAGSRVVVVNRPAGGGLVALNEVFAAQPDGLTIMTFNSGQLLSQVAQLEGTDFDFAKAGWVGKASAEARLLLVTNKSGVRTLEDLRASGAPRIFAASNFGSSSFIQTKLLADAFGLNIKVLPGFGGNEAEAALVKEEVDGILNSESSAPAVLKAGSVRPILRFGDAVIEQFRSVPDGQSVADTAEQRLVVEKIADLNNLGRMTLTTPNTDAGVLSALQEAYRKALSDPELIAEAKLQGLPIVFLDGPATEALVRNFLEQGSSFSMLVAKTLQKQ